MFSIKNVFSRTNSQISKELGNVTLATIVFLLLSALASSLQYIPVSGILSFLLIILSFIATMYLGIGYTNVFLNLSRDKGCKLKNMIVSKRQFLRYLLYSILLYIIMLLIVIPIIIVGSISFISTMMSEASVSFMLSYLFSGWGIFLLIMLIIGILAMVYVSVIFLSAAYLILLDEDEIDTITAMKQSKKLVKNNFFKIILLIILFTIVVSVIFVVSIWMIVTNISLFKTIVISIIDLIIMIMLIPYTALLYSNLFVELMKNDNTSDCASLIALPENMDLVSKIVYAEVYDEEIKDYETTEVEEAKPEDIKDEDSESKSEDVKDEVSESKSEDNKGEDSESKSEDDKDETSESKSEDVNKDSNEAKDEDGNKL